MTEGNLIVNCKVANLRPKYANLREWIEDSGNIFIDKCRFPPKASVFANPHKIGKHGDHNAVIAMYKEYIT